MVHLTNASDDDDDDFVLEDSKSTPVTEAGADDEPHGQKLKCVARQLKRRRQRAKKKQREESQQRQPSPQQVPLNDLSKPTAPPCGRQVGAMRRNVTPPMSQARHRSFRRIVPKQQWWHGNLAGTVRSGYYRGPHHPRRRMVLCLDVVLKNLAENGVHAITHRWKPVLRSRTSSTAVRKA